MNPTDRDAISPDEWAAFEEELLDRAKEIARRITERVRRVTGQGQAGDEPGAGDPPGEVPVFG